MSLSYKEVAIELTAAGEFKATFGGKTVTKPSMAAMKKVIDNSTTFKPFDILYLPFDWSDRIERRTITGTRVRPGSKTSEIVWRDDRGNVYTGGVTDATPENEAALKAYIEMRKANDKLRNDMRTAERAALAAIPRRSPGVQS